MTNVGVNIEEKLRDLHMKRPPIGGWFFLAFLTLLLTAAVNTFLFAPLVLIAPFPMVLCYLLYGRFKGVLLGIVCAIVLTIISWKIDKSFILLSFFMLLFVVAISLSEIFFRKIHPVKGFLWVGTFLTSIFMLLYGVIFLKLGATIKSSLIGLLEKTKGQYLEIVAQNGEANLRTIQDYFANTTQIAEKFLSVTPAIIFVGIFLLIWLTLCMILRNSKAWRVYVEYPYMLRDFFAFKVPDFFVWPLIFALALYVGADHLQLGNAAEIIGENLMYCLGILFFFQGFGIYLDFLTFVRIYGLFRTLIVFLVVFWAWELLVLIGIINFWFDFREFFKRKKKEEA